MGRILKPPSPLDLTPGELSVFLAGSIEMGHAEPWQADFETALKDTPVTLLNPRRDEWDASWTQSIHNEPFRQQVEWELEGLERATMIVLYFAPTTHAPITLLELGLFSLSGRQIVCCPEGYWRRGNVEIVCERYGIPLVPDLPALVTAVRQRLGVG